MTRFTKLVLGAGVAVTLGTGVYTGVNYYSQGTTAVERILVVNEQTALTGTGVGANSTTIYDYQKHSGYQPLVATGGHVNHTIYNFDNPESYTGAIMEFCIDVATAAEGGVSVDCGIVAEDADTSSGVNLFEDESLTAGAHCIVPGSTEVTLGPTQQVRCVSGSGSGESLDANANIMYRETELN